MLSLVLIVCFYLQEAERESQQKWNPIVEISYRGGIYKGHCQGGLPEGKVHCYSSGTLVKASFPGFSSYHVLKLKARVLRGDCLGMGAFMRECGAMGSDQV